MQTLTGASAEDDFLDSVAYEDINSNFSICQNVFNSIFQ